MAAARSLLQFLLTAEEVVPACTWQSNCNLQVTTIYNAIWHTQWARKPLHPRVGNHSLCSEFRPTSWMSSPDKQKKENSITHTYTTPQTKHDTTSYVEDNVTACAMEPISQHVGIHTVEQACLHHCNKLHRLEFVFEKKLYILTAKYANKFRSLCHINHHR